MLGVGRLAQNIADVKLYQPICRDVDDWKSASDASLENQLALRVVWNGR